MKTFFHPTPFSVDDSLLAKLLSGLHAVRRALLEIWTTARHHPRRRLLAVLATVPIAGTAIIALLAIVLTAFINGRGTMPDLLPPDNGQAAPPRQVTAAARETFDNRFVEYKGDLYTIIVHYRENTSAQLGQMMNLFGGGELPTQTVSAAPLIVGIDLIQIKDPRTEVHPADISDADELNGIKWHGRLKLRGNVERRRQLDLTEWMQTIISDKSNQSIPWIDHPLVLADPVLEELTRERTRADAEQEKLQEELANNPFLALMGLSPQAQQESAIGYLKLEPWGDWRECGDACYQNTHLELRDETVTQSTVESSDTALIAGNQVTLAALHTGFFNMADMQDENQTFLTKPNLKALRKAGLLQD